jgi:hypothetical protein
MLFPDPLVPLRIRRVSMLGLEEAELSREMSLLLVVRVTVAA